MTPQQYSNKFERIAEQTSYRLLDTQDQNFLKHQAARFRFTLQELQLVSDMALDRLRWKESPISQAWQQNLRNLDGNVEQKQVAAESKKHFLNQLKQQHDALRNHAKNYTSLTLSDKPKTEKPQ
ncbi:MAG: hypothetical protein ACR2QW_07200, partial [bacterium]